MKQTLAIVLILYVLVYISITCPLCIIYTFFTLTVYSFIDYNNKKND